jgi:chromosome segregation ATPase
MTMQPPWTEIGRLQGEIRTIEREMHNKAESHEFHSLRSRMDRLEHSVREIGAALDGLRAELSDLQAGQVGLP